jgi:uncharacterized protein
MFNIQSIEADLITALKARDQVAADTLRALKTRVQNEKIAKGHELSDDELLALVQSEAKRRKEAEAAFRAGGREDAADQELAELKILERFLPAQVSEEELALYIEQQIQSNQWAQTDFGPAMGALKAHFGNTADGGLISKLLKEKLNG